MAKKSSQKINPSNTPKEIKVESSIAFEESLKRFLNVSVKNDRKLKRKLERFITMKTSIPRMPLPDGMNDHKLDPPLNCWECHLDGDVLLLYTLKNDVLKLIYVCDHDELKGSGIAKIVGQYIN